MHIRIELLRKGGVNIRKIPPADMDPSDGVSIRLNPYFYFEFGSCMFIMYNNRAVGMEREGEDW
jgi:hypothetical protein